MLICDICNEEIELEDAYLLNTTDVTTSQKYWEYALSTLLSYIQDKDRLTVSVLGLAAQGTAWLVCESCSGMFHFNRGVAKDCAFRGIAPPGDGPADPRLATNAAMAAWQAKRAGVIGS